MKNFKFLLIALALAGATLAFRFRSGSIKGSISPAEAVASVMAISSLDTIKSVITDGNFEFSNAKPGVYMIIVEAKPPYKSSVRENINVADGQITDLGQIRLDK
jgi:hypothetical protein